MTEQTQEQQEYTLEDLLKDYNIDLENLEEELAKTDGELQEQLEAAGKELEKKLDKLGHAIKKDLKGLALNFYHNNKEMVNSGLKGLNSAVHQILKEVNHNVDAAIKASEDKETTVELLKLKGEVIKFSMKYNFKYAMLKLKLAFGNAGIEVKNLFK